MGRVKLNGGHDAGLPRRPDSAEHPLSGRAIGCLRAAGIRTVGEFAERSAAEVLFAFAAASFILVVLAGPSRGGPGTG